MNPKELRIVFMGTPEFAVPSLRALVADAADEPVSHQSSTSQP